MIDIRKLKELVKLMVENDLTELDPRIRKKPSPSAEDTPAASSRDNPSCTWRLRAGTPRLLHTPRANGSGSSDSGDTDDGLIAIESPMVGTFYSAPNPDSDNFVKVGDSISSDTVVCLVEAMKVFNEIKAETTGTIAKCLVESGQAVEFGQKLYLVKPN